MVAPPSSRTLAALVAELAERHPGATAIIADERRATYAELAERTLRTAGALRACGIGRGDRVGVLLGNELEWIDLCLGCSALGAVLVPFSTWSRRRELAFLLRDGDVRMLVAADVSGGHDYVADIASLVPEAVGRIPGEWRSDAFPRLERIAFVGKRPLPGAESWSELAWRASPLAGLPAGDRGASPADPAFLLYTSGSSATPKAVPLHHGALIENGYNIGERQGLRLGDRVLLAPPLFWSYGSANALPAALTHAAILVLQSRFEPGEAIDLIERHGCTAIYTLPSITAAIVAHPSFAPERVRTLRTGLTIGSPREVATAAVVLGASEICNVYGQTESYGNCAVTWHDWPIERRQRVQGPPLPGVTVRIVDERGEALPAGQIGQIEVRGYITPGYAGASAEHNPTAFTADGFFRTGDLGALTTEGDVQFVGRDNEMIKRSGINVAPAEVEEILRQHPGVSRVGVAGAPDPSRGEIIVAFVVPAESAPITSEELRAHCRGNAASYKTPDRIELCQSLPFTTTGKLLRRELKRMAEALVATPEP